MKESEITKDEFVERFVKYMTERLTTFGDGASVEEYARETAPTYWDDDRDGGYRADGPEECARSDMSYWGED